MRCKWQSVFFLKVNTARETPAVKYIKKRGTKLTYKASVAAPRGATHRPRPKRAKRGDNKLTIYQTY
jgi:hypothetical protein